MRHPAVAMVGVVGVPDPVRTEIVKAFVQLRPEIAATEALKVDLATYVKTRLAAHEYPREVEFVAELPLTTTGKIMRRELRRLDAERKEASR
jgi:acetyl-CoA synthetase